MTNREYFIHTNMYDILCKMNETLFDAYGNHLHTICIMDCFNSGSTKDRCSRYPDNVDGSKCKDCILAWFNEERSPYL